MIEAILPPAVHAVECVGTRPDAWLYPAEEAVVARAVVKRRTEFATVRACARDALAVLGEPPVPILPGERGAPGWPPGVVGSMTHTRGYCAAAVARTAALRSVGIDAEPDGALPEGVLDAVSDVAEQEALDAVRPACEHPDRVLFSAKEAVYKAWFPITGRFLQFHEVDLRLHADGRFDAVVRLDVPADSPQWPTSLPGRWFTGEGFVLTAVVTHHPAV